MIGSFNINIIPFDRHPTTYFPMEISNDLFIELPRYIFDNDLLNTSVKVVSLLKTYWETRVGFRYESFNEKVSN